MFKIGDYIVYGGEGVCRVTTIGPIPVAYMDQSRIYYTLVPLYHTGVIYAPTDARVPMRPALTRDEANALIERIPHLPADYKLPSNPKLIAAEYKACLQSYECEMLLRLMRMISARRNEAASRGRNFGQTDGRYYKRAKELLYGELALALDLPMDKVESAVARRMEPDAV